MKILLAVFSFLTVLQVEAAIREIAVLDTGLSESKVTAKLCKNGNLDFTNSGNLDDADNRLHGSNVIGLITKFAGNADYCIISLKVFTGNGKRATFNLQGYIRALEYLKKRRPYMVNISIAGVDTEYFIESMLIKELLNLGVILNIAAGNNSLNLNKAGCVVYPACIDPRINVIGNKATSSNTGRYIDAIINGVNQEAAGVTLSGTSQSTAVYTGLMVRKLTKQGAKNGNK